MDNAATSSAPQAEGSQAVSESVSVALLPPFGGRPYAHLPTPQSPVGAGRYGNEPPLSPESPISHGATGQHSSATRQSGPATPRPVASQESLSGRSISDLQQCMTPDASPHASRTSRLYQSPATPRTLHTPTPSQDYAQDLMPKLANPIRTSSSPRAPSPLSFPSKPLSSPFMAAKSIIPEKSSQGVLGSSDQPLAVTIDGPSSNSHSVLLSTSGGEYERLLRVAEEQQKEAERRRPEYLMRSKRPLSESYSMVSEDEERAPEAPPVGITESPSTGRRLKLFQESTEESFETSLMTGGYGRYNSVDWLGQSQQTAAPATTVPAAEARQPSPEAEPLSEREIKKRRRLEAFQLEPNQGYSRLCPIEIEGKGRVIVDLPTEDIIRASSPEAVAAAKRKNVNRRRKKDNQSAVKSSIMGDFAERPNWPDDKFPWKLRTEEWEEHMKEKGTERMKLVARFFDRDSGSEESDGESDSPRRIDDADGTGGRGKVIPLEMSEDDRGETNSTGRKPFTTDAADALTALMAKRSVRTLSYRQFVRHRNGDYVDDEEVLCVCKGTDDGRELVQCDACRVWYHLQCIGITEVEELGREEDPWFCRRCVARSRSPSRERDIPTSEPTFAPTDEHSTARRSPDAFFQPMVQESPVWTRVPRTPTRHTHTQSETIPSSWVIPSRYNPITPQRGRTQGARLTYPPHYEESPFDPTSTPSRGIRFTAPFTTPKTTLWSAKAGPRTPSRGVGRGQTRSLGNFSSFAVTLDEHSSGPAVLSPPARVVGLDDSPVRRNQSFDTAAKRKEGRSLSHTRHAIAPSLLDESPVIRMR